MAIELTEQQRALIQQSAGQQVELIDPETKQLYLLVARDQNEQTSQLAKERAKPSEARWYEIPVSEGIRRSRKALLRDLPKLLENIKIRDRWVAYHGDEKVGIARDSLSLVRKCEKRGYRSDECYIGWINPCELVEEEELEPRPWHTSYDDSDQTIKI